MDKMDHRAAWRDFVDNLLPEIRKGLTRKDLRDIDTAERDFYGKRIRANGEPYALGANRVMLLLERMAPGRYEVEVRVEFRRVG